MGRLSWRPRHVAAALPLHQSRLRLKSTDQEGGTSSAPARSAAPRPFRQVRSDIVLNQVEEPMGFDFKVNGKAAHSDAPSLTPLLWVIREELKLTGTKFGCGTGLCGACMVHIDGKRAFSCQTQVSQAAGKAVTTIEGLSADSSHPV